MMVVIKLVTLVTLVTEEKKRQRTTQEIQIVTNSLMTPLQMSLRQKSLVMMTRAIPMTEMRQTTVRATRKMKMKKALVNRPVGNVY
jgi:hypothetical protein